MEGVSPCCCGLDVHKSLVIVIGATQVAWVLSHRASLHCGQRDGRFGMVPKLLTDTRETSYGIFTPVNSRRSTIELPRGSLIRERGTSLPS